MRQALASAVPPPRKAYPPRPQPAIGAYAAVIDGWLLADRDAPRKQRHTAQRVWQRLVRRARRADRLNEHRGCGGAIRQQTRCTACVEPVPTAGITARPVSGPGTADRSTPAQLPG